MRSNIISWDNLFLKIAFTMSERSKDDSTQCGAVIVDERNVIVSTGFNGPPPQLNDEDIPWNVRPQKYAYIIHAEENAILFGMEKGSVKGCTLYCTHHPCAECVLRCIRAGIRRIVIPECHASYPLSKFQVNPDTVIDLQVYPKLILDKIKPE